MAPVDIPFQAQPGQHFLNTPSAPKVA